MRRAYLDNKTLAKIHIAKKYLCLEDDEYRDLLFAACGVRSAADILPEQLPSLQRALRRAGWPGTLRSDIPSDAQLRKLEELFSEVSVARDKRAALDSFLKRFGAKLSSLNLRQYSAAMAAVRAMSRRQHELARESD